MDDDIICTEKIIADRKTFCIDLKSNARGRVVRITEKVSSNRDRIMVPAEILDDFIAALEDIRRANNENWCGSCPPSPGWYYILLVGLTDICLDKRLDLCFNLLETKAKKSIIF